ncbi:hypothetical protein CR513_23947, partial [Mucuna pruriens]
MPEGFTSHPFGSYPSKPGKGGRATSGLFHKQGPSRCRKEISEDREGHPCSSDNLFVTELTPVGMPTTEEGEWFLSVDGLPNRTGSGVGIVLKGPDGVLIKQSLHFEFRASNNQAEYKALLAGMKLARELEVRRLTAKSDSRLVTGQVNGEYQTRDP